MILASLYTVNYVGKQCIVILLVFVEMMLIFQEQLIVLFLLLFLLSTHRYVVTHYRYCSKIRTNYFSLRK